MIKRVESKEKSEFAFLQYVDFDGSWKFTTEKCYELLSDFIYNLNRQCKNTKFRVLAFKENEYTQKDSIAILKWVLKELNERSKDTPLKVVILEDDKSRKHKLDIQTVRKGIYIKRTNPKDHLSKDEVDAIKTLYADGYKKWEIAEGLGYSRNTVSKYLEQ